MTDAFEIIRRDHLNVDAVLGVLKESSDKVAAQASRGGRKPNLDLMYSIIHYIRMFPDAYHHPKEEKYLFPILRRRAPDTANLIDRLREQHESGERLIAALKAALDNADRSYPDGVEELCDTVDAYIAFQRRHIGLEERELLPRARAVLDKDDWAEIDRAFARDSDPLFGENLATGFRALFERITARV